MEEDHTNPWALLMSCLFVVRGTLATVNGCWVIQSLWWCSMFVTALAWFHDDVTKWKHFPRYWPFVRGTHRSPVNSPHKGQQRRALIFSLICVWINGWVNNREAGDLKRHRAHYNVIVMFLIMVRRRRNSSLAIVGSNVELFQHGIYVSPVFRKLYCTYLQNTGQHWLLGYS